MTTYISPASSNGTIISRLICFAEQDPADIAYTFLANGDEVSEQLSYGQLLQQARAIASHLHNEMSIQKGDRVVLLFCPGLDFVRALYGCLFAGVIALPVNPPSSVSQSWRNFLSIAENASATLILTDATKEKFLQRQNQAFSEEPDARRVDIAHINMNIAHDHPPADVDAKDVALLQYTSGTTSLPKGVVVTHENIMHNLKRISEQVYQGNKVTVSWLPIYHDMGLFGGVLEALYSHGHCILMPPSSFLAKPIRWLKAITKFQAAVSGGPNFAFDLCADAISDEALAEIDLSCWKIAASGAEPVLGPTLRRFGAKFFKSGFNPKGFVPCYGLAESTLLACANKVDKNAPPTLLSVNKDALANRVIQIESDGALAKEFVSCGQPDVDDVVIVDTDTLRLKIEDHVGEIWIRGASVATGYWNNIELSNGVFNQSVRGQDGYYRTGDLGFLHKGEIYISGRIKELIIIRGKNHYPGDIEHSIQGASNDLMLDCGSVFSIIVDGMERLVALQEVKQAALKNLDVSKVLESMQQAVIQHHEIKLDGVVLLKPGRVFKTSSGKIRRSACRDSYLAGEFSSEALGQWLSNLLEPFIKDGGRTPSKNGVRHEPQHIIEDFSELLNNVDKTDINAIVRFLTGKLSTVLNKEASTINPDIEYNLLGLDSVEAVELMGDIADALDIDEDDDLWDSESLTDIAVSIRSKFN
ncbi:MAG: AMP-binding protein [Pseudomonadales bacterium]|nr:AMP-binding protein [Pseudomonadales bacterium]